MSVAPEKSLALGVPPQLSSLEDPCHRQFRNAVGVVAEDPLKHIEGVLAKSWRCGTDRIDAAGHTEPGSLYPHRTMLAMGCLPEVIAVFQLRVT